MTKPQGVNGVKELWQSVLGELGKSLSPEALRQWLGGVVPLSMTDREIRLGVSDEFFAGWIETHYGELIGEALARVSGRSLLPRYEPGHAPEESLTQTEVKPRLELVREETPTTPTNCHARFTFDNFVVGPENRFAYAAAMGIARKSAVTNPNPLFIYGGTGLGKTHLLQAIAHEAHRHRAGLVIEYLTCEEFMNLYVDALRQQHHAAFRNRFRRADYLMIDDIQFLAKTKQLQEEFFNTFNTLHNKDKKILLTSDKRPAEIGGLEARLVGRFDSGLTVEIIPLGMETRLAILRKKQDEHLTKLDDEVLSFIAESISSNVRRLEGAVTRVITYCSLAGTVADLAATKDILAPFLEEEATARISIEAIQKRVVEHYDLRLADLTGGKRPQNIAVPRMIAMYLSRRLTDHSTTEIGNAFGGRNHATVIHACHRIAASRKAEEQLDRTVAFLERQLQHR